MVDIHFDFVEACIFQETTTKYPLDEFQMYFIFHQNKLLSRYRYFDRFPAQVHSLKSLI